jgi:hypothetical protein
VQHVSDTTTLAGWYRRSGRSIGDWLARRVALLDALCDLRTLGAEAGPAVEALLRVPETNRMRLSLELFEALTRGDGFDPEPLLLTGASADIVRRARHALFGTTDSVVVPMWGGRP